MTNKAPQQRRTSASPSGLRDRKPVLLTEMPKPYEEFTAQFHDRRGYAYVAEMFRRHRSPAATVATAAA